VTRPLPTLLALLVLLSLPAPTRADVPPTISFTARINDGGTALGGAHNFVFRLFDAETGGTERWAETHTSISVEQGLVAVALGSHAPLTPAILTGEPLWIEVTLDSETMSPRLPLRTVPYAARAGDAATLTGAGMAVGHAVFAPLPYAYETIQLAPSANLRVAFGGTEHLRLENNGRLLLSSNPGDCPSGWFCNGYFWDLSVASILYSGLAQRSDARLKRDIRSIGDGALETIRQLRPVTFAWKDPRQPGRQHGFIAQEVEAVLPSLVSRTPDGTLALDTTELLPIVLQAVKDLDAREREQRDGWLSWRTIALLAIAGLVVRRRRR
jgi:hypothetical protein